MTSDPQALLEESRARISNAKSILSKILDTPPTPESTLPLYNRLSMEIDSALATSSLIANVHPDKALREVAEQCEQEVSQFATELSLNRQLYDTFAKLEGAELDPLTQRLVTKELKDFRRSGVDKDAATREQIKTLREELVQIGQEFGRNLREDVRAIELDSAEDLDGLPDDYIQAHLPTEDGKKIRISTDYPDYIPFMHYAKNGDARKKLSFESKNRGFPKNIDILDQLLAKRHELAKILGYAHWADYVTEDKMIKSADAVRSFIGEVATIARPRADRELEMLAAEKGDTPVGDWEKSFYEERVKQAHFSFDSQSVRPYFEYGAVKKGLLDLTSELFGIEYHEVDAEVWHPSVEAYDVIETSGKVSLGRIYLDMHPRPDKYKHAAQFTLRTGVEGEQLPEGVLVCNFPDPSAAHGPALMVHDQVVTFFHEFGHLLHHTLGGHQRWVRFSGVATEWDFVEAPSQFFEEWAWDPSVLQRFALHHESGESIPADLVAKMREADKFGQGIAVRQQMFYASVSLNYYNQDPSNFDTTDLLKTLQAEYSMFPYMEDTHFQTNFGHLDGYSAIYYTYMWSLVISKDLLTPFKENGMMNNEIAMHYRKSILDPGGTKDAADLVEDFLGRPYSFDAFRDWLENE